MLASASASGARKRAPRRGALQRYHRSPPSRLDQREAQLGLEQVAVHAEAEFPLLQRRQTRGDAEAQTAALGGAGGVAPDEPLRQLVGGHVQGVTGHVLHGEQHRLVHGLAGQVDP